MIPSERRASSMDSVGACAESISMVDLRSERFTGPCAHSGTECAVPGSAEASYRLSREL